MEFRRKKQKGVDRRTRRLWVSECGNYRITWTNEVCGVSVAPHYFAMVRCYVTPYGPDQWFTFAGKRGPYGKLPQAIEACEKNEKLWLYAIQVSEGDRKGRNDRLRAIDMKARIGKGPQNNRVMAYLPVWVRGKANPVLMNLYFPRPGAVVEEDEPCSEPASSISNQNDPTDLSLTSEQKSSTSAPARKRSSKKTQTDGPASNAKASAESTTRKTRRTLSKVTNSATSSSVPSATEPAAAIEPSSRARTTKRSASTVKKRGDGKKGKPSADPVSAS
jgi:hypothetical protein